MQYYMCTAVRVNRWGFRENKAAGGASNRRKRLLLLLRFCWGWRLRGSWEYAMGGTDIGDDARLACDRS